MTKDKIEKKIKTYSDIRYAILYALILLLFLMFGFVGCAYAFNKTWLANCSLIFYLLLIMVMIFACVFPLGKPLVEVITSENYKVILEFFTQNSDGLKERQYIDGLIMLKRSLNNMVYRHMNNEEGKIREHIFYLQGIVFGGNNKGVIPKCLFNRTYFKELCRTLLQQINDNDLKECEIETIIVAEEENVKRSIHVSTEAVTIFCIVILFAIVIAKVVLTINPAWHNWGAGKLFLEIFYNTSADIIAIILAVASLKPQL